MGEAKIQSRSKDTALGPASPGFRFTLQDASGLVDFRDVALALAALDGSRDLEELTLLAFEVPGDWGWRGHHSCAHRTQKPVWCGVLLPVASR